MNTALQQKLIAGVISVVSECGLENTTTKKVSVMSEVNESLIFRAFSGKEELLVKAFEYITAEFAGILHNNAEVLTYKSLPEEDRWYLFFCKVWEYLIREPEKCEFYVQMMYSSYYTNEMYVKHVECFRQFAENDLNGVLPESGRTEMMLKNALYTILNFAKRVAQGYYEDKDAARDDVFQLIYSTIPTESEVRKAAAV